jgi:hypothetical protein
MGEWVAMDGGGLADARGCWLWSFGGKKKAKRFRGKDRWGHLVGRKACMSPVRSRDGARCPAEKPMEGGDESVGASCPVTEFEIRGEVLSRYAAGGRVARRPRRRGRAVGRTHALVWLLS